MARERSKDDKYAFRLNSLLYEFQLFFNSADVALKYEEVEPLVNIADELVEKYGEYNVTREQLLALGEAELRSKRIQRSVRAKGSVKFPADVSFEDLMDVVDESIVADLRAVAEPLISSIVTTLDGAGGMASNAVAHELIALLQPIGGSFIRSTNTRLIGSSKSRSSGFSSTIATAASFSSKRASFANCQVSSSGASQARTRCSYSARTSSSTKCFNERR